MWKPLLCLCLCLLASAAAAQETPQDIQVCESAFDDAGQWRYPNQDALSAALMEAAEKTAVTEFFGAKLDVHPSAALSRETLVTALQQLLQYDETALTAENPLDFCMVLKHCRIDAADLKRFDAVEICRVCGINADLVATQTAEIRDAFLKRLTGGDASLDSVTRMMAAPERIAGQDADTLKALVHDATVDPPPESLDGYACRSLYVYPVEFFAATVADAR